MLARQDSRAEAVGFEPTVSFPTHDFQSCRFGRSRTPPIDRWHWSAPVVPIDPSGYSAGSVGLVGGPPGRPQGDTAPVRHAACGGRRWRHAPERSYPGGSRDRTQGLKSRRHEPVGSPQTRWGISAECRQYMAIFYLDEVEEICRKQCE